MLSTKQTPEGDITGVKIMTNTTQETNNNVSYSELIAMIRDAARDGRLSVKDLRELREYAARLLRESDGTPEAEIA